MDLYCKSNLNLSVDLKILNDVSNLQFKHLQLENYPAQQKHLNQALDRTYLELLDYAINKVPRSYQEYYEMSEATINEEIQVTGNENHVVNLNKS